VLWNARQKQPQDNHWAAWLPGALPGGPAGPASKWAVKSNVEVGRSKEFVLGLFVVTPFPPPKCVVWGVKVNSMLSILTS